MFEFHGWARVESTSGRMVWQDDGVYKPDDADLIIRLEQEIEKVSELSRECVDLRQTINGMVSLTVSGLRNHHDETIIHLFEWLAENGKRSTGVLFTSDDEDQDREYDSNTHFRVFRLACGEFKELDTLFEMPPYPNPPLFENKLQK